MSGLLDSLSAAAASLQAARLGIDVAGQNLANVNTPGYSRRTVLLSEVPPTDPMNAGRGVAVTGVQAQRDPFIDARIHAETQGGAFDSAVLDGLTEIEAAVGLPGQSLDATLASFFDAFSTLASDPTSVTARDGVVVQGQQFALAVRTMNDRFNSARSDADTSLKSAVEEVNYLASEVATLNAAIVNGGTQVESLRDERDVAITKLSQLIGVNATPTSDGTVDVTVGSGRALVIGTSAFPLTTSTTPSGFTEVESGGVDITAELPSGRVGGLLAVRDRIVPGYQARLDQLAYDVSTEVNALHGSGFDANGAAGGDFFSPLSGATGAAGALAVDAAVVADSRLVVASGTGAPGDNQTARAIAALRDARVVNSSSATPTEAWAQLAYRVGADVARSRASGQSHDEVLRQLDILRAQVSGVSMDEEAANLMRFQRAYEANARYFSTIVDTIDAMLNMVR